MGITPNLENDLSGCLPRCQRFIMCATEQSTSSLQSWTASLHPSAAEVAWAHLSVLAVWEIGPKFSEDPCQDHMIPLKGNPNAPY